MSPKMKVRLKLLEHIQNDLNPRQEIWRREGHLHRLLDQICTNLVLLDRVISQKSSWVHGLRLIVTHDPGGQDPLRNFALSPHYQRV